MNLSLNLAEVSGLLGAAALAFVVRFAGAIAVLLIGYLLVRWLSGAANRMMARSSRLEATLIPVFGATLRYGLMIAVLIAALAQLGVQTTSLLAVIGAAGLAIGLALQGTLQNIAAGIMLLALRPFRIGESVEVGAISGSIEEIGLFATRLRTADGVYILAPNSTLWNQPVRNFSRNGVRRADISLSIGSWNDIDGAQKTLLAIAAAEKRIRREPAPIAFVASLGDTTVSLTLRYWTAAADYFSTNIDMTKRAKQAFDSAGISIPLPPPEAPVTEARKQ